MKETNWKKKLKKALIYTAAFIGVIFIMLMTSNINFFDWLASYKKPGERKITREVETSGIVDDTDAQDSTDDASADDSTAASGDAQADSPDQAQAAPAKAEKFKIVKNTADIPKKEERRRLSNPNATKEAVSLYNYICDVYGNAILAGQQESTWINNNPDDEMEYIYANTGKLPAIRGLDYINEDFDGVTKRSIEWWEMGGIPSICFHWGAPTLGVGYEASKLTINVAEALKPDTDLNKAMVADMDRVAVELKKLQDAGVPVLWRPFHEFNGNWFWWSKSGAEVFKELWRFMYDRYTNYHGLNNLIWVLGYSRRPDPDWYPGDEYVDIAGTDEYAEGIQSQYYWPFMDFIDSDMPLVYHECGPIPDPDEMIEQQVHWTWFLTWHTIHIKEQNSTKYINAVYNHDYVITLDELPDLKSYE
jgi:hypothetical protein